VVKRTAQPGASLQQPRAGGGYVSGGNRDEEGVASDVARANGRPMALISTFVGCRPPFSCTKLCLQLLSSRLSCCASMAQSPRLARRHRGHRRAPLPPNFSPARLKIVQKGAIQYCAPFFAAPLSCLLARVGAGSAPGGPGSPLACRRAISAVTLAAVATRCGAMPPRQEVQRRVAAAAAAVAVAVAAGRGDPKASHR